MTTLTPIYNLNKILEIDEFSYDLKDGIRDIKISKIKLKSYNGHIDITLSLLDKHNGINEVINNYFHTNPFNGFTVKEIELAIKLHGKLLMIKIHYMRGCNLKNLKKEEALICQKHLKYWSLI